jgi:hypothetical protein
MAGEKSAAYRYRGRELRVADLGGSWRVAMDGREVEDRFLDHALARLLGASSSSVLPLVRRLLEAEPGADLDARA